MASWSSTDCPQVAPVGIFDTFNVDRDAILGRQLHELENGQGDEPDLRHLLEAAIHRNQTCLDKTPVKRNTRPEPGAIIGADRATACVYWGILFHGFYRS